MVHLVLIRPGSTEYDLQGRIQGTLDIPLCQQGREEVGRAIEGLKGRSLGVIYCDPGAAATQTAEIIGEALNAKVKTVENLKNLDHGLWQGMLVDEVKHKQPKVYRQWQEHPENVCPPSGEMLSDAAARVEEALEKLLRRHREGTIGLVVSEPLATLVANRLRGDELGDLWKTQNGCKCCQEFEINAADWRRELAFAPHGGLQSESNGK